jgi:4'-phosphopantetheinyl transferase
MGPRPPGPDAVHIWRIDAAAPCPPLSLTPDERLRAGRFVRSSDADRFTAGRSATRRVLGCYTGIDPLALRFTLSSTGKPSLTGDAAAAGLTFNLSHSGALALLAVGRGQELGVDIELLRHDLPVADLARRVLDPLDAGGVLALREPARTVEFLRHWTRKEAYLKATGIGLGASLDCVGGDQLWIHDLDVGDGYVAAVAVECRDPRMTLLPFQPHAAIGSTT